MIIPYSTLSMLLTPDPYDLPLALREFVAFYEGKQEIRLDKRRVASLQDIWDYSPQEKEDIHSYIQWLFPTDRPSDFNARGPCFDLGEFALLKKNETIIDNVIHSFKAMLEFFHLQLEESFGGYVVTKSSSFDEKADWLRSSDHNQLRISRILRSLHLFGRQEIADAFHEFLLTLKGTTRIKPKTFGFWEKNLHGEEVD